MGKVTDEQILIAALNAENGSPVGVECKKLHITPKTFYLRRKRLEATQKQVSNRLQEVTSELPMTIQRIQGELQTIISELKGMKGRDTREQLSIMDRKIAALDKLNNTLKTTQILVDNRQVNIEVREQTRHEIAQWVYDTILRKGGPEMADKVMAMLSEG